MTDSTTSMRPLARQEDVLVREVAGDVVLYDRHSQKAHSLNPTAAAVWRLCDGARSVDDLTAALDVELPEEGRRRAVLLALRQLGDAGLLEEASVDGAFLGAISRREAVRRIGYGAVVAAMVPVVASLVAPSSAEASSCREPGQTCTSSLQCCSGLCQPASGTCA